MIPIFSLKWLEQHQVKVISWNCRFPASVCLFVFGRKRRVNMWEEWRVSVEGLLP